jgi:uncharacterized membrane protein YGL010W
MHQATHLLSQYALYHRDQRNIATHFFGVPLIVLGIGLLLAQPAVAFAGWSWTPAWGIFAATALWYLVRGGWVLGGLTALLVGTLVCLAHHLTQGQAAEDVLSWGAMVFAVGWMIQFLGHWYEGKKTAFMDDVSGLLVGPLFITAEALFARGWNPALSAEIERRAGPTFLRDMAI